jgi:oligopeptide transport system ATP-binding protein
MPGSPALGAGLLEVSGLHVSFSTPDGEVRAVNGVDFSLEAGRTLGIVGESGSGKSQSMLAIMGLLAPNGRAEGRAMFRGQDLLSLPVRELNRIRGDRIAMIFQDPMTSLNPYLTVERQMTEVLELHKNLSRADARRRSIEVLEKVRIPDAARRIRMYPHEFSGGMRQRIMIAMALLCEPDLLIADEPTTALDVTVQAQIVAMLRDLQRDFGTAIIMITHDLGVVAGLCDEVIVMYGGRAMESGSAERIFYEPTHPYTLGLLNAAPRMDHDAGTLAAIPGTPPNMAHPPAGCPFHPRCPFAFDRCVVERPALIDGRACHLDAADVRAQGWRAAA